MVVKTMLTIDSQATEAAMAVKFHTSKPVLVLRFHPRHAPVLVLRFHPRHASNACSAAGHLADSNPCS